MSHTSLRRGVAALGVAALAATGLAAAPAQAGLLDPLQPVVGSVLDPVLSTVTGITGELVPTGWLYDGSATPMREARSAIGADTLWSRGYTGRGVGVALVDTGVVPVSGLDSGNVTNGAGLSFESQARRCAISTPSATAPTWPGSSLGGPLAACSTWTSSRGSPLTPS